MKKTYVKIDWEITFLMTKDIITASRTYDYDPEGLLNDQNADNSNWVW